jgi:hypothetical protein
VRGCEHWSVTALNSVLEALPMHVNALSLQQQLQQQQLQGLAVFGGVGIPDAIQTLTLEHINAFVHFGEHSRVKELIIEGTANVLLDVLASLRSITVRRAAVVAGSTAAVAAAANYVCRLPPVPYGVTVVDASESGIVQDYFLCGVQPEGRLPDSITVLKLPNTLRVLRYQLPAHLEVLDTGYRYNASLGVLSPELRELYIKRSAEFINEPYEHALGALPYGLEVLHVANMMHSLGVLPST